MTNCRYVRASGALWRDTGAHVLVLPTHHKADVVVLGGGGAVLWRLLSQPLAVAEIQEAFDDHGDAAPDADTVLGCLDEMVGCRVVSRVPEQEPR